MNESMNEQKTVLRPPILWANLCYLLSAVIQQPLAHIVVMLFALFAPQTDVGVISNTATASYQILILGLSGVWFAFRHRETAPSLRLNPPSFGLMVGAAALAFSGALLANSLGTWWMLLIDRLGGTLYPSSIEIPTDSQGLMYSILLIGVLPGMCEELFFRGMMMGSWEARGTRTALVVTSVLFGLLHGSLLGFPVQLMMGFVLGWLLLMSNSLYVSMTFHTTYNSATLLLAYLSAQSSTAADTAAMYENLNAYVSQSIGYLPLLQSTLMNLGIFAGIFALMHRGRSAVELLPASSKRMDRKEIILLLAALAAAGFLWAQDLARVW